jgi:predicted transcriptional regulator
MRANEMDTAKLSSDTLKQNICLACYDSPQTIDELTDKLDFPKTFMEENLNWLIEKEFLAEDKGKYHVLFPIITPAFKAEIVKLLLKH